MAIFKDGGASHSDRSQGDRKRHRELVEDAIRRNLGDIVAEESIIGQSKDKKIKVPIKGIKEYRFMYGTNSPGVAGGQGGEKRGQVIDKIGSDPARGQGVGQGAGSEPGEDVYETEITLDQLIGYLFDDLKLPDLERKRFAALEQEALFRRAGYQKKGIAPRLAKKRTMVEKIKRSKVMHRRAAEEEDVSPAPTEEEETQRIPFRIDDLRYFRVKEDVRRHSNAVAICIMDTSGSMDQTKKYLARSFYFLLHQFLRWKYEQVEVVFISHSTVAKEVNESQFFHHGESGGTYISSGYAKALEIIEERYNPSVWNIYAFHCTDGDNWTEDNPKTVALARELCEICNLFGYGQVLAAYNYGIRELLAKEVKAENFVMVNINRKEDIWTSFRRILEKEGDAAGGELP
ncbi:sporulation protein YhbH [Azotosporobacter soli]|uniref:sporulation protein YhbH n=1 Tax=Azotosporobacter soli TaxID=3055040 RepID=UPI0031FF2068